MSDHTNHRALAEAHLEQSRRSPALIDHTAMASVHYLAHIANLTEEIRDLVEALGGPAVTEAVEAAAINAPDICNLCGGLNSDHQKIAIHSPEGGIQKLITCPRDFRDASPDAVFAPVYTFPTRPDSKDLRA